MAVLIGQVYYPHYEVKTENGKEKSSFRCSLATRKAFLDDEKKPNLFTPVVTYSPAVAKALNDYFGKEEHKGKSVVLYGHFNEYTWEPDGNNPDHDKFFQEFTITNDIFTQGGVRLAEGSAQELKILIPVTQTTRQFVTNGFEFADSANAARTAKPADKPASKIKVAGVASTASAGTAADGSSLPVDDDRPF